MIDRSSVQGSPVKKKIGRMLMSIWMSEDRLEHHLHISHEQDLCEILKFVINTVAKF